MATMLDRTMAAADRLHSPGWRRRAGTLMVASAVIGVVVAAVGTFVIWRLIGSAGGATTDTVEVTIEALDSTEDTLEVVEGTVGSTSDALTELERTLNTLSASLDSGGGVVEDAGSLTETAGPALEDAAVTFRTLEGVGDDIDALLSGLAGLPLTPSFDPSAGLGATFGQVADDLEPLPAAFEETSGSLRDFRGSLDELSADVDGLAATIGQVNDRLVAGSVLIDQYRANVTEAKAIAEGSRNDLQRDRTQLRVIVIIGGLNIALAQLVPLWFGLELLAGAGRPRRDTDGTTAVDPSDDPTAELPLGGSREPTGEVPTGSSS